MTSTAPIHILMAEDNPADVKLTQIALERSKLHNTLHVVEDGVEALEYLRNQGKYLNAKLPDIVLLDLNMPKMGGHDVLNEIKNDKALKHIPVVILTSSDAEADVLSSYQSHANCYITKPIDMSQFSKIVSAIENFWFTIVKLPPKNEQ